MTTQILSGLRRLFFSYAALVCVIVSVRDQSQPAAGTIEGRIFNPATGEYLEFVRVTVDGTRLETFTDVTGTYRLTGVPAGEVTVRVFRTGTPAQPREVSVTPGGGRATGF